jgi:hypothetical protein
MDISTKYDFGQEVWFVDEKFELDLCPACEGHKMVTLNGVEYVCPSCYGQGKVPNEFTYHPFSGSVRRVQCDENKNISYTLACSHRGTMGCTEDELFPTEAEAQAEADRMNKERKQVDR